MAELLTHVLVPYVLLTIAGWRVEFDRRWVPVAMGGAAIPDLSKIAIVLDSKTVEQAIGHGFTWSPISSLAGVLVIGAAISLLFGDRLRRRAYAALLFGGTSALVVDGLRVFADGRSNFWLYPIYWRPPTPSLYVTSDSRVTVVAVSVAVAVFLLDRYVSASREHASTA
ncbi:metal-dependent hydrolase [Haloarcula halophila]|uniref:metal-dependent hydrolase n=1 Tax=Haloarcula TaxID=2237 RepID=UPI0023E3702D|nr:metal-dependent hydrolase [Halomicroarcula sp. DFY41]